MEAIEAQMTKLTDELEHVKKRLAIAEHEVKTLHHRLSYALPNSGIAYRKCEIDKCVKREQNRGYDDPFTTCIKCTKVLCTFHTRCLYTCYGNAFYCEKCLHNYFSARD